MGIITSPVSTMDVYGPKPLNGRTLLREGELGFGFNQRSGGWQERLSHEEAAPRGRGSANAES